MTIIADIRFNEAVRTGAAIRLGPEERLELERIVQAGGHPDKKLQKEILAGQRALKELNRRSLLGRRASIILQLAQEKITRKKVANKVGCTVPMVDKWRARWLTRHPKSMPENVLADNFRSGRPAILGGNFVDVLDSDPPLGHSHWTAELLANRLWPDQSGHIHTAGRMLRKYKEIFG